MKQDKHKTDVLFLWEQPSEDGQDVFAFFPNEKYNSNPKLFESYSHIGQHSACHIDYANKCLQASPEQYSDLEKELTQIGYNLNILNK